MEWKKPARLMEGDSVAIVSPSRTIASLFPPLASRGMDNIRERLGLNPVLFPHAMSSPDEGYHHPEYRAEDINTALADPAIRGIISTIGGDESVRILNHLDPDLPRRDAKVFCGFSDCTTITVFLWSRRVCSIYGGAILAGFAQMSNFPDTFTSHWRGMLMSDSAGLSMKRYGSYSEGYPDWKAKGATGAVNRKKRSPKWQWIVGESMKGRIFAGCIETVDALRGTQWLKSAEDFEGALILLETSEEMPSPLAVERYVRNLGIMGFLEASAGMAFGRFRGYSPKQRDDVMRRIARVMRVEFGCGDKPLAAGLDFGHTDPYFPIPVGVEAEISGDRIRLAESLTV